MSDQLTFDAPQFDDEQTALLGDIETVPAAWRNDDGQEAGEQ